MKILVADDDQIFRTLLQWTVAKWGYEVQSVGDGEEAWDRISSEGGPRLAILDWQMPKSDGLDVCRRVRSAALGHYVYLILLTAQNGAGHKVAGMEAGADDYVLKPFNPSELELRLRAGRRVLEFEETYRVIAETASDGILTVAAGDRIQFANRSAGNIFGLQISELIGKPLSRFIPSLVESLDSADWSNHEPEAGDCHHTREPLTIPGKHSTGVDLILEMSMSHSGRRSEGQSITVMIRDVTERRRRECQEGQARKLESLGQLAAGVAHEINTPIQYIGDNLSFIASSFSTVGDGLDFYQQVLESCTQAGPVLAKADEFRKTNDLNYLRSEVPAAIQQALEGVQQVAKIVQAMKEFSHPGSAQMAPVNINHLLENTILVSQNKWKYVAEVETHLDPDLPAVTATSNELSQVFLNLIVNAADAISDSKLHGEKGRIIVASRTVGAYAEIRVKDTGSGIPVEIRGRVFDPFFTTKDVGVGTGQGLAISHTIVVTKHHGTIGFETVLGGGTEFTVRLPIAPLTHGFALTAAAPDALALA